MKTNCLFALSIVTILLLSCSAQKQKKITLGWVNENTYRIQATGRPDPGAITLEDRDRSAIYAAKLTAQVTLLKKFKDILDKAVHPMANDRFFYIDKYFRENKFKQIIKNGKVIKVDFDKDQNCVIIFEIKSMNLQNKVYGLNK